MISHKLFSVKGVIVPGQTGSTLDGGGLLLLPGVDLSLLWTWKSCRSAIFPPRQAAVPQAPRAGNRFVSAGERSPPTVLPALDYPGRYALPGHHRRHSGRNLRRPCIPSPPVPPLGRTLRNDGKAWENGRDLESTPGRKLLFYRGLRESYSWHLLCSEANLLRGGRRIFTPR